MKTPHSFSSVVKIVMCIAVVALLPFSLSAADVHSELQDVLVAHEVTRILLELGIIILAAKAGGFFAKRIGLPALLGEVSLGVLLGPYAFGSVPLPGFADGLFPLAPGVFPISLPLYSFASVGAVIHVLVVGLESDIGLFSRVRQRGFAIAFGSSILAIAAGAVIGTRVFGFPLFDRRVFFLAALSVSTALGVQARILHSQNKMGTAEGGAIFSASLLQDGFAIIFLAIAMAVGSVELGLRTGSSVWQAALPVTLLAVAVLVGGTLVTFWAAPRLARIFRNWLSPNLFVTLIVALSMVLAAVFEVFGVAAIIGAYVIGLAFSRTDIGDVLTEKCQPISEFFVPVLYVVMGMLVDFRVMFSPSIMAAGIGFAALSAFAKVAGSFFPALASGFTPMGAIRIGVGTVPRGEVALIIASVGLALGDFSPELFKVMIVMIVFSVALGSPLLSLLLRIGGSGTRGNWGRIENETAVLDLPNEELANLIAEGLLHVAENDGFFVHRLELSGTVYRLRKDEIFLTMYKHPTRLEITCAPEDIGLAKTFLYEVIIHVHDRMSRITEVSVPQDLRRDMACGTGRCTMDLGQYLRTDRVVVPLHATTKDGVIAELVECLDKAGAITNRKQVLLDVLDREHSASTGLERGVAIPHARSDGVTDMCLAAGIAPHGVDFQALDGQPCSLIFLLVSPAEQRQPHLQLLAAIAGSIRKEGRVESALKARKPRDLVAAVLQP